MIKVFRAISIITLLLPIMGLGSNVDGGFKCPPIDYNSHLTINNNGNSSYLIPPNQIDIMKNFISSMKIKPSTLVLDVGGGYGLMTDALLKSGISNIIFNDLSSKNIYCAKKAFIKNNKEEATRVKYLQGDINSQKVIDKLPNHKIGLVFARNVLQFFDATELDTFLKTMSTKMKKDGVIYFTVDQGFPLSELKNMNQIIMDKMSGNPKSDSEFNKIQSKCVNKNYPNIKNKTTLFPCDYKIPMGWFHSAYKQFLMPSILANILSKYGFITTQSSYIIGNNGTAMFDLLAYKTDVDK